MIESKTLPEIVDLGNTEIDDLLTKINFGHLGLSKDDRPYVVPIHFAYGKPGIYFFTTEGMKTDILDENPTVCLQLEDIQDRDNWKSLIIIGKAERLSEPQEIETAMKMIKKINPRLSPAWSIRWLDNWVRSNVEVIYRITPETMSGRTTLDKK